MCLQFAIRAKVLLCIYKSASRITCWSPNPNTTEASTHLPHAARRKQQDPSPVHAELQRHSSCTKKVERGKETESAHALHRFAHPERGPPTAPICTPTRHFISKSSSDFDTPGQRTSSQASLISINPISSTGDVRE